MYILGISCFYHDAAAVLIKDGHMVAAAQEERFTRIKHDPSFPENAINFCLNFAGIKVADLSDIGFYEKPFIKFERLLETYLKVCPRGFGSFLESIPIWLKEKLWLKAFIQKKLGWKKEIIFLPHHLSHAASSFLVSPFRKAAILTMDGVGEWETTTLGYGENNKIHSIGAINFPHSLGLLYSAFTYYCGFRVNSGEYKLMGLAPNGQPKFVKKIYENLIEMYPDGSFKLNMDYFAYEHNLRMINQKFCRLFGREPLVPDKLPHPQFYCDVAASIQQVTEEVILGIVDSLYKKTKLTNLCLAGGVALNCVANGRILRESKFNKLYIQPAAGDAGGALGAAFYISNCLLRHKRTYVMDNVYLGPSYSDEEIKEFLVERAIPYLRIEDDRLFNKTARLLAQQKIIGWFQGRMEWGPRALGNRSILADARNPKMKDILNAKIKHREPFRPFAPVVMENKISQYFDLKVPSPFMLLTAQVKKSKQHLPAITHVDNSARIQSVNPRQNRLYYSLLKAFYRLTGCPVLVNTSFNIRGESIVCTPQDAYNCFMGTEMDYLVIGNFLLDKKKMKKERKDKEFKYNFQPD